MNKQATAYTKEEIREHFLNHIHNLVDYWLKESRIPDTKKKLEGLAFSILTAIDGCAVGLPAFLLIPSPHPDDKKYHKARGEKWYPDDVDIAGCLHELLHKVTEVKMSPIPAKDRKNTYSLRQFMEDTVNSVFLDDDGIGYYATETEVSNLIALPSEIAEGRVNHKFTHIVWHNK